MPVPVPLPPSGWRCGQILAFHAGTWAAGGRREELPEGRGYIRDQLRRAANFLALDIAEGAGEFVPAENARFYRMAKRSGPPTDDESASPMRGLEKARGEWGLVCMCHNVRRLHAARVAGRTAS